MRPSLSLLVGAASTILLTVTLGPGPANAQCATGARIFANVTGGSAISKNRIAIEGTCDGATASVASPVLGRFWSSIDSRIGNNMVDVAGGDFAVDPTACPTLGNGQANGGWWLAVPGGLRGIAGGISATGCIASSCPDSDLTVVVEDYGSGCAPGVGEAAYFIGYRRHRAPGSLRDWDLAIDPDQTVHPMLPFPEPIVRSSGRFGNQVIIGWDAADPATNVHADTFGNRATSTVIQSFDFVEAVGFVDPGRDRANWTVVRTIPYLDGPLLGETYVFGCGDTIQDTWIAIGLNFEGGDGPAIPSALVGRAIQLECNPHTAHPEPDLRPGSRPTIRRGRRLGVRL